LIAVLDKFSGVGGNARAPTGRAQARDGLGILLGHILVLVEFDEVFARGDDLRPLGDGEDGRALRREGGSDRFV
jgi:hypothetical protein